MFLYYRDIKTKLYISDLFPEFNNEYYTMYFRKKEN